MQELKFAALAQAKTSEDLLKSYSKDRELITLGTSVLEKKIPTFKQDTLDSPSSKLQSMLKAVDYHFESLEKVADVNILIYFNAMRLRTILRMVEDDRVSLITSVRSIREALNEGGKIYKSCLLLLKFTIDLDKKIKECEGQLASISQSY